MSNLEQSPTALMKFRWPWRPYQQRVLTEIERHLEDRKLHIVAAPGSGKTVLGLEVFRRLGRPAIVVSPTITIRDQWVARVADFLPGGESGTAPWVSTDLTDPGFLTSITYQALHTKYRGAQQLLEDEVSEGRDEIDEAPNPEELREDVARFRAAGVGTLILDEAHHLREAWWKALQHFVEQLPGVTLVSLTATPPFDVVGTAWERYESLCGPIDAEISVPELVKTGTLCAHQDYVFLVEAKTASSEIQQYDEAVQRVLDDLVADAVFAARVQEHPWVRAASPEPEQVLDRPEVAYSLLVYLNARGAESPEGLMTLLDCAPADLPEWDRRWCQILLEEYLYGPDSRDGDDDRGRLANRLRNAGLLWRRQLRILRSPALDRKLSLAPEKIEGCLNVCREEWRQRGPLLRQAILTDFILDDELDRGDLDATRIGAWPIFRTLAGELPSEQAERVALLTGRLVVVHESRVEELRRRAGSIAATPLDRLPGFQRLGVGGGGLVRVLTDLLSAGDLQVLVGTRALLGEGWDAPCVNSLILATYVGSFMQTNQLRGRAIRSDPMQIDKAASVWHIAAIVPSSSSGCSDFTDLERRFDTFVGLAATRAMIESGLHRLELPQTKCGLWPAATSADAAQFNHEMFRRLEEDANLAARWKAATEAGTLGQVLPSVRAEAPPEIRAFHFNRTLRYLLLTGAAALLSVAGYSLGVVRDTIRIAARLEVDSEITFWMLALAIVGSVALSLPRLVGGLRRVWRAFRISLRHLPVDGSVRQIAVALHDGLRQAGLIKDGLAQTDGAPRRSSPGLSVVQLEDGRFSIALTDAPFYQQELFADCLAEILGPVQNPRYLIVREGSTDAGLRYDYHAVPQILASNKERAELLFAAWTQLVGPAELVYTRSFEGRRQLLKARARAFSTAFADCTERRDHWQ